MNEAQSVATALANLLLVEEPVALAIFVLTSPNASLFFDRAAAFAVSSETLEVQDEKA